MTKEFYKKTAQSVKKSNLEKNFKGLNNNVKRLMKKSRFLRILEINFKSLNNNVKRLIKKSRFLNTE